MNIFRLIGWLLLAGLASRIGSFAQDTAFTYQGRLNNGGVPATGIYDFRFTLYDALEGDGVIEEPLSVFAVGVTNGLFTTQLDFGSAPFNGQPRWLEIAARTNGTPSYQTLSPRQPVDSTPYAIRAANFSGAINDAQLSGNVARLNADQTFTGAIQFNNASNAYTGTFQGNGAWLTNLAAESLVTHLGDSVSAWDRNGVAQTNVPPNLNDLIAVSAGDFHYLGLRSNGTVVAWGQNGAGQATVPPGLTNIVAVSAGGQHNLVLQNNGTVAAWGSNGSGQRTIPPGLSDIAAIDAGIEFNLVLRSNGTVFAWGENSHGQTNVPANVTNVIAIAAGWRHAVALFSNGTVAVWGDAAFGQANIPAAATGIVAIAAGDRHILALRSDGRVIAWGSNAGGATNVPPGLKNVVAISAGGDSSAARRSDGTIIAWGNNGKPTVPNGVAHATSFSAGYETGVALQPTEIPSRFASLDGPNSFSSAIQIAGGSAGEGALGVGGDIYLNGHDLLLSHGDIFDHNHGLGYYGTFRGDKPFGNTYLNGPVLYGSSGGGLGTTGGGRKLALTWLQNGYVGIGTSQPQSPLEVVGSNPFPHLRIRAATNAPYGSFLSIDARSITNGKEYLIFSTGNLAGEGAGKLIFQNHTDARQIMALTASGNVGIGKLNPEQLLHVGDLNTAGSQGMIRLESRSAASGIASRAWEIGVPQTGDDVAGQGYSYVVNDMSVANSQAEFIIRWDNHNVGIGTNNPVSKLHVVGAITCTSLTQTSDRDAKENFAPISPAEVLDKVNALPITSWNFKELQDGRHIGPMAQDFQAAFGLGDGDTTIATVDANGVALAAIQGLNQKLEETRAELKRRDAENAELKQRLDVLEKIVRNLPTN